MQVTQQNCPPLFEATVGSSLLDDLGNARWQVPGRGDPALAVPGFSTSYWVQVTGRSYSTVVRWKQEMARVTWGAEIAKLMTQIEPADGMLMARLRGSCQMPFWSRLAILEYRKRGFSAREIAAAFGCSPRTVFYLTQRTIATNPERRLTPHQLNPPSKKPKIFSD